MFVGAHPDDETAVGPLLARAAEQTKVIVVCFTKGEGGANKVGPELDAALGEIRAKELAAAAKVLGVEHRILGFWNGLPGGMRNPENPRETPEQAIARWRQSGRDPAGELVKAIRQWRPDIIISFDPAQGFTGHKEHRAVAMLTAAAFQEAADAGKYAEHLKEGLKTWQPRQLYQVVNRYPDNPRLPQIDEQRISELIDGNVRSPKRNKTYAEIGLEAFASHPSQVGQDLQQPAFATRMRRQIEQTALILAASAPAKTAVKLKPLKSLWYAEAGFLNAERLPKLTAGLKRWEQVFDAFPQRILPPTFGDAQSSIKQLNELNRALNGSLVVATFPVGRTGWETSFNERLAARGGWKYEAGKAVSQQEWLTTLKDAEAEIWAWVLEQPANIPTPEQAAASALEFISAARAQRKTVVIWLSAMGLRGPAQAALRGVCAATKGKADYFVWMDLPGVAVEQALGRRPASPEEGRMNAGVLSTLEQLLDTIVTLTPPEQTVIQWTHNARLPTQDVAGTTDYLDACQRKGINRFCLFYSLRGLEQEPWQEFYRTLTKA